MARLGAVMAGARFVPFTAEEIADGRDRALANRLVTTALRRRGHLDLILGELLTRGLPRKAGTFEPILRVALAQLVYLPEHGPHSAVFLAVEALKRDPGGQHLRGLLNAVLRHAQANAARYWSLPEELLVPERYRGWPGLAAAILAGAPLDLTLRDQDPELVAELGATPVMADTVRLESRDRPVEALPGYSDGRWWAQDAAAAIPARQIKAAPSRVLDLCAAPGGKTAQLVKAGHRVTALDADRARLDRLGTNLHRLGYAAELVEADAATWRPAVTYDAVLLDAPCTATGTVRRHPEVLWRQSARGLDSLVALQRAMLMNAAACMRPGGTLVYCVCSIEPAEGEEQAQWVAASLPGLEPLPIGLPEFPEAVTPEGHVRTWPGLGAPGAAGGTLDGFFVARYRKA